MRVLEIIDDASVGGGQQHVLLLAEGLKEKGVHVTVACEEKGFLVDALRERGIPMASVTLRNNLDVRSVLHLWNVCRREKFDVVHTHGGTAGFWGRLAGTLARVPVRIHTYHGLHTVYNTNAFVRYFYLVAERALLWITTKVITVSDADYQLGFRYGLVTERKATVIKNGIRTESFVTTTNREERRREFAFHPSHVVIGMVGRFHLQKGHEYLIEAMPKVFNGHPEARFLLVGEGELLERCRRKVSELALDGCVRFAGARYDVPELLAAMDIFVLPSLWEGLPLTLLEASSAGKAIVATDVEGNRELIQDGVNGFLVPPRDPESLATALARLLENEQLRTALGMRAKAIALEEYDAKRMVDTIADLYRQTRKATSGS